MSAPNKIRLLYITDTYVGGKAGSERHLFNLVTRLEKDRFDITIVQLTQKSDIPFLDGNMAGRDNVRVLHKPVGRVYSPAGIAVSREISSLARSLDADIVQSFHEKADIINALIPKRDGKPLKISSRRDMGFKKGRRLQILFRLLNRRFDILCAPSRAILAGLTQSENVDRDRTRLLYNGVDLDRFEVSNPQKLMAAREQIGVPSKAICFGCVANLKAVKGHRYLLEAFSRVAAERDDIWLVLVGEGEERAALEQLTKTMPANERVLFLGQRNDVDTLLHAFDVLISSSLSEGLSNALIEAAACGLPIVATRVGGNPEVVRHGDNGYLVTAGDSDDLEFHLRQILNDPDARRRMGVRARELVRERFSMNEMMGAYRQMYSSTRDANALSKT